jgi:hypothetical protein
VGRRRDHRRAGRPPRRAGRLAWIHRSSWMPRCRGCRPWPIGRTSSG